VICPIPLYTIAYLWIRFLLARLHVDSLCDKPTKKAVKSTLKSLPKGSAAIYKAYDDAIERIKNQLPGEYELAKKTISWITYAKRQLTTKEISHALAVEAGESELDEDNIPDTEHMISVCAGLVVVDEESDIIRLVHYTTQEYFEYVREAWNPKAQEEIASTCLTYLSFHTFDTGYCYSEEDLSCKITQNPFLEYAAKYWGNHAFAVQPTIEKLALPFLRSMNQVTCSTQVMLVTSSVGYEYKYDQNIPMEVTGIHLAAFLGMEYLLQELTHGDGNDVCMNIEARDSHGRTPLSWAAASGHEAVVKLLVERDDVVADAKDKYGRTPLWWAAASGHEAVVKLLVERDDVVADLKDNDGQTPLSRAAQYGHEAAVKLLVERDDVEADSKANDGHTPLSAAAEIGHEAVVKLLLERDDVVADSKDEGGRTPLLSAAESGQEAIVKLLLERGDVVADSKDEYGRTPLWWAAASGYEAVVKLLVERDDVVPDLKDNDGQSPLSTAAEYGYEAIVKLLERDSRTS
jgi:ankyrin repeat protein